MKNIIERDFEETGEIDLEKVNFLVEKITSLPENKRIDPNDFKNSNMKRIIDGREIDAFPFNMIKGDLEEVEKKKKWIGNKEIELSEEERNANLLAEFVEVAVPEAIRELDWLGKVKVIRPSLYDDYFRGIDNIVRMLPDEIIEGEKDLKCMGFSIDFTISEEKAKEKTFDAMLDIVRGDVPSVKYFSADVLTKQGSKNIKIRDFEIPRIIMFCPHEILKKAQKDLLNFENDQDNVEAKQGAKDTILRYYFIRESLKQLEFYADLAERVGKTKVKDMYNNSLESFGRIIKDLGIDEVVLNDKLEGIPEFIGNFDLDANKGQFVGILKEMAKNTNKN